MHAVSSIFQGQPRECITNPTSAVSSSWMGSNFAQLGSYCRINKSTVSLTGREGGDCLRSCRSRKCRVIGRCKLGLFKSLMHAGTHSDVLGPKIILVRGWENIAGKWRQKCVTKPRTGIIFGLSRWRAWRVCSAKCKKRRNRHSPSKTERATHSAAADSNCLSKSGGN